MRRDTIFRIASLTKPIAAVAALILVEECRLRLDDPVDRLLPEPADRKVLQRLDGPLDETAPANRPISLRDLLTLRMGSGYIVDLPGDYPIEVAFGELQLLTGPSLSDAPSGDEWVRRLGTLPLMRQPGERWMYDTGMNVLGVLIARAAGQPLETFLRERIFEPLGMKDTGFWVPAAQLDRLPPCYRPDSDLGALELFDGAADSRWSRPPGFAEAAGGLVSTVDDYLSFKQMLLHKGRHGNTRILSRPAVEAMVTDQLEPGQQAAAGFLAANQGWGLGLSVITRRDDLSAVPGRFGWDGGYGTSCYADPAEDLVAILMTQRLLPDTVGLFPDFWTSVYQAIDD